MLKAVVMLSVVMFACYAGPKEDGRNACSPNDVLRLIGNALATGDTSALRPVILRASDLIPRKTSGPADDHVRQEFDQETLQDVAGAVSAMSTRYKGSQVQRVEPGVIDRRVAVEGMDIIVDRMRDGRIVFVRDGQETTFTVAALISAGGCWKIEHLGTGVADSAGAPHGRSLRPPEKSGFRPFTNDFCTGLAIYAAPRRDLKIGSLVEGYRKYRDPKTNRVYETVLLQSLATGHVRGIWMNFQQLASTYVDRSDHALQDCKWSTREEEVSPLPDETPAPVPHDGES